MTSVAAAGASNWDTLILSRGFPRPGMGVRAVSVLEFPGGKAANVATAVTRILGREEGAVISAVGEDELGRRLLRGLQNEGVDVRGLFVIEGEPSGRAFVVVDEGTGENMIISFHGALTMLGRDHVDLADVRDTVASSKVIVVMDVPVGFMEGLVDLALGEGKTVVLAPGIKASESPELVKSLMRRVDYLVLNEWELAELAGPGDPDRGAVALSREGPKVVVTLGSRGSLLAGSGGELIVQPSVDLGRMGLKVVNSVGCGDAFIGVFAALKAAGSGDAEALRRATIAGAYKATRLEVRGSPTLEQLLRFEEAAREAGALDERRGSAQALHQGSDPGGFHEPRVQQDQAGARAERDPGPERRGEVLDTPRDIPGHGPEPHGEVPQAQRAREAREGPGQGHAPPRQQREGRQEAAAQEERRDKAVQGREVERRVLVRDRLSQGGQAGGGRHAEGPGAEPRQPPHNNAPGAHR